MVDFSALKKNRKSQLADLQKLTKESNTNRSNNADDRIWNLQRDKTGNGYAVIRFLPSQTSDVPYERLFSHAFKNPKTNQWYIENSRTTIDQPDPMGEMNQKLWNAGQQDQARQQKRTLKFFANILVIKDPANPENNGTVKIFRFGKKIFERIEQAFQPPFDEEGRSVDHEQYDPTNAFNPFDMWEGKNFNIKIRTVDKFPNYDNSEWMETSAIAKKDADIQEIFEQTHDLKELVAEDQFKSYDELQARINKVFGLNDQGDTVSPPTNEESRGSVGKEDIPFDSDDDEVDLDKLLEDLDKD